MNIIILYFSATGNTAIIAKEIEKTLTEMGVEVITSDITPYESRKDEIDLEPYDAVVFGAPIHALRAPRVVREWMRTLDGKGKKCTMFFTYGGFKVHPTHYSTKQILEKQNFIVVSSAEFLGAHTYNLGGHKAMVGRPDANDLKVAKEFAQVTYKRFAGEDEGVLGELEKTELTDEQLDALETMKFSWVTQLPTRSGEECSMCMVCEKLCPTGAMVAEAGEADKEKCITCLACIFNCPEDALSVNDMSKNWSLKLELSETTEDAMKKKKSKIFL